MQTMTIDTDALSDALAQHTVACAAQRASVWPVHSNRGSELAWPCPAGPRYLWLLRRHWQELTPEGGETILLFEEGHTHEAAIARRLEEDGWTLWKPRKAASWPAYQITGSLDREARIPEKVAALLGLDPDGMYLLEMKALEPNAWGRIHTIADLVNAKRPWLRKYPGQLLMYLLLNEEPVGMFVLKSKVSGQLKYLPMVLEEWLDLGESLLRLCEQVNQHLADGTEPPVHDYDDSVCPRCRVRAVCLPGEAGAGAIPITEEEFAEQLGRRDDLKAAHDEYKELDDLCKEKAKAASPEDGRLVCANWEITVKTVTRNYKSTEARTLTWREARIRRLGGGK